MVSRHLYLAPLMMGSLLLSLVMGDPTGYDGHSPHMAFTAICLLTLGSSYMFFSTEMRLIGNSKTYLSYSKIWLETVNNSNLRASLLVMTGLASFIYSASLYTDITDSHGKGLQIACSLGMLLGITALIDGVFLIQDNKLLSKTSMLFFVFTPLAGNLTISLLGQYEDFIKQIALSAAYSSLYVVFVFILNALFISSIADELIDVTGKGPKLRPNVFI